MLRGKTGWSILPQGILTLFYTMLSKLPVVGTSGGKDLLNGFQGFYGDLEGLQWSKSKYINCLW